MHVVREIMSNPRSHSSPLSRLDNVSPRNLCSELRFSGSNQHQQLSTTPTNVRNFYGHQQFREERQEPLRRRTEHATSWLPSELEDPQHPIPSVLDEVKALLASEISKINDTVKLVCDRISLLEQSVKQLESRLETTDGVASGKKVSKRRRLTPLALQVNEPCHIHSRAYNIAFTDENQKGTRFIWRGLQFENSRAVA